MEYYLKCGKVGMAAVAVGAVGRVGSAVCCPLSNDNYNYPLMTIRNAH